ncbi:hypothetical protein SEUCBS139899_004082 [Sporothrix eucalyptigena]|uniref:Uncharacterized protein n=1 Tax=Sporothrix eucalyptigena TaxID=1812306 RepID=A0ABP0BEM4_9PEZI
MCCNLNRQSSRIKIRQDGDNIDDNGLTESAAGQQQLLFTGPDICLASGLCQLQLADAQTGRTATPIQFSRDSCTRPDWAGGCLKNVCSSVTGDNAALTPCGSNGNFGSASAVSAANQTTQWCCGSVGSSSTASCCTLWPNHPDAVFVPLSFGDSSLSSSSSLTGASGGGNADPPRVGPSNPVNSVSVSIGPGGVVTLVTITTGAGIGPTASSLPQSASFVGSRPVTNSASASTNTASGGARSSSTGATTALGALATGNNAGNSSNGETVVTGATGLNTQEVAGIVAGLVVVVVVLVSVACFTAESIYKKRQQRYRARRLDEAMKQTYPIGAKSRPLM